MSLEALEYIVELCFKVRLRELGITKQSKNVALCWESSIVGPCVLSTCMRGCDLGFTLAEVDQAIQSIFLEPPPNTH